jgi:uncharacterized protein (DUF885 family)
MNDPSLSKKNFIDMVQVFKEYKQLLVKNKSSLDNKIKIFRLEQLIQELKYEPYLFPITQFRGFHFWLDVGLDIDEKFKQDFKTAMNDCCDNLKLGIEKKRTLPIAIVDIIIEQCEQKQQCQDIIQPFILFLKNEYKQHARETIGLYNLNNNDEEYEFNIFVETTLEMKSNEIFEIGIHEMKKTVNKLTNLLVPTNKYIESNINLETKEQINNFILNHPQIKGEHKKFTYSLYNLSNITNVRVNIPFKLNLINNEHNCHAYYRGKTNNHPYAELTINMKSKQTDYSLYNLLAHEIVPGHHLEVSNNYKQWHESDLWYFTHFSSYIEGWAFYSESLSEVGLKGTIFRTQMELLRNARIIIDAGIHSHTCGRWTYEEAFQFLKTGLFRKKYIVFNFVGLALTDKEIKCEILRCASRPGHSTCYKIGELYFSSYKKMEEEKGKSEQEINDCFLKKRVPLKYLPDLFSEQTETPSNHFHEIFKTKSSPTHVAYMQNRLMYHSF